MKIKNLLTEGYSISFVIEYRYKNYVFIRYTNFTFKCSRTIMTLKEIFVLKTYSHHIKRF